MTSLLAAAVALDVPIYIHPHLAPAVREAYFGGLEPSTGRVLEAADWGWHSETAIHVLRMVLAGTLDEHRGLKLIIGHMGEMLPMMLARADDVFGPTSRTCSDRSASRSWTRSGSPPAASSPSRPCPAHLGIDRIMFSVDYPYARTTRPPISSTISLAPADMAKLTHGNADALLKLKRGWPPRPTAAWAKIASRADSRAEQAVPRDFARPTAAGCRPRG